MRLLVMPIADEEADAAADWYETRQRDLGADFLDEYARVLLKIERRGDSFTQLETVHENLNIRRARLQRFPYYVVFQICDEYDMVLADIHERRRPNYWLWRVRT